MIFCEEVKIQRNFNWLFRSPSWLFKSEHIHEIVRKLFATISKFIEIDLIYFMQGIWINQRPTSSARVVPQSHTRHGDCM